VHPQHHPPDEALVEAVRSGELAAFNVLVERYQRTVYAVAFRLLRDRFLAEDITQDAFLRAYASLETYRGGNFRAWLLRIAHNRALDALRSMQRRPATSLELTGAGERGTWSGEPAPPSLVEHAARAELRQRLEAALATLPDDQRVTVILSDIEGCSYEEIASITGASLGTVKSRLSRGRARLRAALVADERARELLDDFVRQASNGPGERSTGPD
jgi:RNA polymerase sigma-70 factor (ECF subfamily)